MSLLDCNINYSKEIINSLIIKYIKDNYVVAEEEIDSIKIEYGLICVNNILKHPDRYVIGAKFDGKHTILRVCNIKSIYNDFYKHNDLKLSKILKQ